MAEYVEASTSCAMRFEMIVRDKAVREAWFQADGCECCEGLASLLVELIEGLHEQEVANLTPSDLVSKASAYSELGSGSQSSPGDWPPCYVLPLTTLRAALASPLDSIDQELGDFSGPSLREEC